MTAAPPVYMVAVEPRGIGAVVRDVFGDLWVRVHPDGGPAKWARVDYRAWCDSDPWSVWSALPAVEVLSEGVVL